MSELPRPILLTNFRLFDGRSPTLRERRRLIIDDGRVSAIVTGDAGAPDGTRVIDCGGRKSCRA